MRLFVLAVLALLAISPARAIGPEDTNLDGDPNWRQAQFHVARGEFREALPLLHRVRAAFPISAEAASELGHAYRRLGVMDAAKRFYDAALAIDRMSLPALSYQGRWFVETGDLASARNNLETLAALCGTCAAWRDLDQAIRDKAGR